MKASHAVMVCCPEKVCSISARFAKPNNRSTGVIINLYTDKGAESYRVKSYKIHFFKETMAPVAPATVIAKPEPTDRIVHRHTDARGDLIIYKFDHAQLCAAQPPMDLSPTSFPPLRTTVQFRDPFKTPVAKCTHGVRKNCVEGESALTVFHEWRHVLPQSINLHSVLLDEEGARERWIKEKKPPVGLILWEGDDGAGRRVRARFVGWGAHPLGIKEKGYVVEVFKG